MPCKNTLLCIGYLNTQSILKGTYKKVNMIAEKETCYGPNLTGTRQSVPLLCILISTFDFKLKKNTSVKCVEFNENVLNGLALFLSHRHITDGQTVNHKFSSIFCLYQTFIDVNIDFILQHC